MRKLLTALAILAMPLALSAGEKLNMDEVLAACEDISVDALQAQIDSEAPPTILDANGKRTRGKYGVIPGARLLDGKKGRALLAQLPDAKDAQLVFYCGGQACMAAPKAAYRAKLAGYTNVKVLRAGISGWVAAGKKTQNDS